MYSFCGMDNTFCNNTTVELCNAILVPVILNISMLPNPVNQNTSLSLSVSIIEKEFVQETLISYCGTLNCGQDLIL
ncbi:MAG: hypothetical protein HUJ77_14540 [Clostridium sp.]|uniref:hypothetical protein n=1 Tax=Clostridium sp. TaxID=1506 RepID=UPI0025B98DDF|nr:hypothetical protein [Clostridium sp.]MCF0149600.1 hypothetical protein [Clostridium sp.]